MQSKAHSRSLPTMIWMLVLLCGAVAIPAPAQNSFFATLVNFDGTDGSNPFTGLAQASDGNLYGTTSTGGAYGNGTVFKITSGGALTTLHSFCSHETGCTDGFIPYAGVVQGTDGNFYGATAGGGTGGGGVFFAMTPSGTLTPLYSFCSQPNCSDGSDAVAGPIQGNNGNLYGTTALGGTGYCGGGGCGTVFKITTAGTLTTMHDFDGMDGAGPEAPLLQADDGNFYGTTANGGANGYGTIFKITPAGSLTTLYNFCAQTGCPDGAGSQGGLLQASDGNFYGVTVGGGAYQYGTIFKITPGGAFTTLHSFDGSDGRWPYAGLVQARDGNFYGTTDDDGNHDYGTVFVFTPAGMLTTLHYFHGSDGSEPKGLVQAPDGSFYGTTYFGGTYGYAYGTVFRLGIVRRCATCRP